MSTLTDRIYVRNSFEDLPSLLNGYPQVFCVYDAAVGEYIEKVKKSGAIIKDTFPIIANEEQKTIETVLGINAWLLERNANRNDLLLTVGGGITSDMGGFAASIYKRGIDFAYIPTTLLSQVDAAIGGKTGVNFKSYKNILGTIVQPKFTYINVNTLETLSKRDFLSGVAELLKTFIIGDAKSYSESVSFLKNKNEYRAGIETYIKKAAMIKAGIVERDEYESGERRKLNLGHTFAHAIEWYQQENNIVDGLSHGEAVAVGICQAAKMSEKLGLCREGLAMEIKNDFDRCGLPTELPYPINEIEDSFFKDKKAEQGGVNFVLIRAIGDVDTMLLTRQQWQGIRNFFG